MVWVLAPGKNLKAVQATGGTEAVFAHVDLQISLESATDFDYRVTDERGRPLAGAVVEPLHYRTPRGYEILPAGALELLRRTTDASGRVRLTSLSRKALYQLQIRTARFGTQQQRIDDPVRSPPVRTIEVRAAGSIEGRLIADDPRWVRGVKLLFQDRAKTSRRLGHRRGGPGRDGRTGAFPHPGDCRWGGSHFAGRPAGQVSVGTAPAEKFVVKAGKTVHLDIPMETLVLVKGTVRTDDTHGPLPGPRFSSITARDGRGATSRPTVRAITSARPGRSRLHSSHLDAARNERTIMNSLANRGVNRFRFRRVRSLSCRPSS